MKREIEFKAWHIEEKKMCEVSIINLSKGAFLVGVKPGPDLFDEEDEEKEFNFTPQDGRFCYFDEFELLQFAGLTDKNGVKIFEGDRLTIKDSIFTGYGEPANADDIPEFYANSESVVIFKDGAFCVEEPNSQVMIPLQSYNTEDVWVIGNIHDNPE